MFEKRRDVLRRSRVAGTQGTGCATEHSIPHDTVSCAEGNGVLAGGTGHASVVS